MDGPVSLGHRNIPPFPPKQISIQDSQHWNSILKGHTKLRSDQAILTTYTQMESLGISSDVTTFPLVLKACTHLRAVEKSKKRHNHISDMNLVDDVRVQTALIDFYAKCGLLKNAGQVFDEMTDRDVVSWNAMISGCVGCCEYEVALTLFDRMQKQRFRADSVTLVALLLACGRLLELRLGKAIHGYCLRNGLFDSNFHVGTSLMGFYLRFDTRITISWNAM